MTVPAANLLRPPSQRRPSSIGESNIVADKQISLSAGPDPLTIGRRVRHLRQRQGRTLDDLAGAVGISASALSLIENGKREAKISVLTALATALDSSLADLLSVAAPSRRAALEIELEKSQRLDSYQALQIPAVRPGPRLPIEALEALVG